MLTWNILRICVFKNWFERERGSGEKSKREREREKEKKGGKREIEREICCSTYAFIGHFLYVPWCIDTLTSWPGLEYLKTTTIYIWE